MAGYKHEDDELDDLQDFALDGEDEAAEGANILMVVVVSLLFLTAFGCVVWVAYNNGVAHGRNEVLTQNTEAVRVARTEKLPEGLTDKMTDGAARSTLPAPEPAPQARAPEAATAGPVAKQIVESMQKAHETPQARPHKAAPVAKSAAPHKKIQAKAAAKPEVRHPAQSVAQSGAYSLQVGAFPSQAEAESAWKRFAAKQRTLLSGAGHHIQKADLGSKGTWYRLRVGAFATKAEATALCSKVKANGGACFPTR